MTSGQFASVPITSIWVDRDARQRRELTDVSELADSIKRLGLIHPPVITRDGELKAGERRWSACKSLGWTHIPVQYLDELDPVQLHLIELEENIKRVNITWQEECEAIARYDQLRRTLDPKWDTSKTAEAIGLGESMTGRKILIAKEIKAGNERVINAPALSTAYNITDRVRQRRAAAVLDKIAPAPTEVPLLNVDFAEWVKTYDGPKFNFLHCDFPYGIDADKHDQGAGAEMGGYQDTIQNYISLLETLWDSMDNVVAPSAHLMFWFSMKHYVMTRDQLRAMGWEVFPHPLIWFKSDNTGILPDPNRQPRQVYETAFFCSRGDRKLVQPVANLFAAPATKSIHMSEKSLPMLTHFFRMFVDEYTVMLDPTCGSAGAVKVAKKMGAASVLGLELNTEFFNLAKEHFNE